MNRKLLPLLLLLIPALPASAQDPGAKLSPHLGQLLDGAVVVDGSAAEPWGVRTDDVEGPQLLVDPSTGGECLAVSSDGTQICGTANFGDVATGFYWSEATGAIDIGMLPDDTFNGSTALGIADNGWIVGFNSNAFFGSPEALIWTPEDGLMAFVDFLDMHEVEYPDGAFFYNCTDISGDGTTIVGNFLAEGGIFLEAFKVVLDDVVSIEYGG